MTPPAEERRKSMDTLLGEMHIDIKYTKEKIDKVDVKMDDVNKDLHKLDKKVAVLEVKAGIWGAVSGGISSGIAWFIFHLRN